MNTDVCIIGGGIMGCCAALFLRQSDPNCNVLVLEPDPSYAQASSARSASSIRQQFSTALNVQMSQFGLGYVRNPEQYLSIEAQEAPSSGFTESGYLFLATAAGFSLLQSSWNMQVEMGAPVGLFTAQELSMRLPWINVADLAGASLGLQGEGWFDGYMFTRAVRSKAIALGAKFQTSRVVKLNRRGGLLTAAITDDAQTIPASAFINAAGPWSRSIAAMAGIDLPVYARRRTVFSMRCATVLGKTPLVIDTSGVWFRSEGQSGSQFIGGWSPSVGDEDPNDLPLEADLHQFESHVWPAMAHRVPAFEALKVEHAWAGYYEYNALDQNALLGKHPTCDNLYFMNGFSGHGLQHAPAAGRGIAELILHGQYRTLDLSPLSIQRLVDGRTYLETSII